MDDITRYRKLFPHLESDNIYLNHAAIGPFTKNVIGRINEHLTQRSSGLIDNFKKDLRVMENCRDKLAQLIHAESAERFAFTTNTSEAINIVAGGLQLKKGDHILLNTAEFPANVYPYVNLKSKGVAIDFIKDQDGVITPAMIEDAITPNTRVLGLSAVQFLSGYRADLKTIGALCQKHDIIFVVDGIQAVGAMDINVQEMNIDALASGAHKWQMGPQGIGFLYVSEQLQNKLQQTSVGWLSVETPWQLFNYNQSLSETARRYETGTYNIPGIYGYDAALELLLEVGVATIENRLHNLTQIIVEKFSDTKNASVYTPIEARGRAGIVTLTLTESIDAEQLLVYLKSQHITLAVREGKVRFSPHFYNTEEEVAQTVSILKDYLVNYR
jgi:cysteine desulfurase/selenocysteine lyase